MGTTRGRVFRRGKVWWVAYNYQGTEHRESTHSDKREDAKELLKKRLGQIYTNKYTPNYKNLTFEDMVEDLRADYELNGRRSTETMESHVKNLGRFFNGMKVVNITPDRFRRYQQQRLREGKAVATVNRETSCMNKMLNLQVKLGKLPSKPPLHPLAGEKVREGFLEHGDFLAIKAYIVDYLKNFIEWSYLIGWRRGEISSLKWSDVEMSSRCIRLSSRQTKEKTPRVLPLEGRLWEIIQEQWAVRDLECPYVFHRNGKKIGDIRKAWSNALDKAKLKGVVPHDLRRCAARNLSRAGVPESVAMKILGHKTRHMFERYRIVNENDLREAVESLEGFLERSDKTRTITKLEPRKTGTK